MKREPAPFRAVVDVLRSDAEPSAWCLYLECGHQRWTTATRKPRTKRVRCQSCPRSGEVARGTDGLFRKG